jgi:hypothetical protein
MADLKVAATSWKEQGSDHSQGARRVLWNANPVHQGYQAGAVLVRYGGEFQA